MKDQIKYIQKYIETNEDLPKEGLYFCAITDDCFGSFHFNPDDKDDIDFWIGNVMWYLIPFSDSDHFFQFIDWMYPKYSKYWGSDQPNNGKWYVCNTILSQRKFYTLEELYNFWYSNVFSKTKKG
jgi:hypothetical protein